MSECSFVKEQMPLLITESLDSATRERAHLHIDDCAACDAEWESTRRTWQLMSELPEVPVPARLRGRFLAEAEALSPRRGIVVPFRRHVAKYAAQAAAVLVLVGGSYFTGRYSAPAPPAPHVAESVPAFSIAETSVIPASDINPDIQGRPEIANVQFIKNDGSNEQIGVSFDLKSRVTVTGAPSDRNMVKLLSYFLQNRESTQSRSSAIEWVHDQYVTSGSAADPEIVKALASLLKNDTHEGVRIKAVEALKSMPPSATGEVKAALVEALKNDPNPAVRIKAVEALSNLARSTKTLDNSTLDTLRQKASQLDENAYVRVKAAEALSHVDL